MAGQRPLLRITVSRSGDTAVVSLAGELDVATAPELQATLAGLLNDEDAVRRLRVEARDLTFVDVAGLEPLLAARARMVGDDAFQLRNPTRQVLRVLRLLDLAAAMGIDA